MITNFENNERFEENQKQSQTITDERPPLQSLSLMTKTTANDGPKPCSSPFFSDLEKRKHKNFL